MTHELILGGQRSGKSRCAEQRATDWLNQPEREALLIATARAGDAEMAARIQRHRQDRSVAGLRLDTLEEPLFLAEALARHSAPHQLIVVDCLTLWLTNWLMPVETPAQPDAEAWSRERQALLDTLPTLPGPVVLVGNEIGLGLSPLGAEVRCFVDEQGRLHQALAQRCEQVTLMVAGLELPIRRSPGHDPRGMKDRL
jgi:adenosylcobinamide kinase/adenosylcobinamide-phosphate guanylyltransferase